MARKKLSIKGKITEYARSIGASLVGFAPASRWADYHELHPDYYPEAIWPQVKTVIVLGIPILLPIVETTPSINYQEQYTTANILLDQISYRLAIHLNNYGHASIFLPRDGYGNIKILLEKPVASFSHVYAAKYAGLGTIGYSHNLVNKEYGPRVRYVSVFTQLEVEGDAVIEGDLCTKCLLCQKLCPSQAFTTRQDCMVADMDKVACTKYHAKLVDESRWPCGVCIKVCPIGEDRKLYNSNNIKRYLEENEAIEADADDPRYKGWVHVRTHGSQNKMS